MSKYNVYGLGNALVDMEFEVSPEMLAQNQIDKGVMTLIEEDRHHELLAKLDGSQSRQTGGGSAANTLIAISQFGGQSFYSCKVASDNTGTFFMEDMKACGVATNLERQERPEGHTGKCLVFVTPDADRTMNTYLGISASLAPTELVPEAIVESEYLYMEGYLVTSPTAKAAALQAYTLARQAGKKIALSLSDLNMVKFFKPGLQEMIGSGVDLLFANESEALAMADTSEMTTAIDYFKTIAKTFAITRGPQGSLVFDGQSLLEIDPVPVKAVDTVGAGDMYAGALLYGITNGMDFARAGKLASAASAKLVTELGARMPTDRVKALLS